MDIVYVSNHTKFIILSMKLNKLTKHVATYMRNYLH
jgi:hypothetical protein